MSFLALRLNRDREREREREGGVGRAVRYVECLPSALFSVRFFALCRLLADGKEGGRLVFFKQLLGGPPLPLCRLVADGKEQADGKGFLCHQPVLCRLLSGS